MANSGDLINYTIRTKKSIERKIFLEICRKLINFDSLNNYQYIGMGSKYFVDFKLFHRELGIENMVSIEGDSVREERYRFNIPFKCIKFKPGYTSEILPKLDYSKRSIIWLDYDGGFCLSVIGDIETICTNVISGSFFAFSVNSNFSKIGNPTEMCQYDSDCNKLNLKYSRLEWCKKEFGDRFPEYDYETNESTEEKHLTPKNATKIIRKMVNNEIERVLADRNALTEDEDEKYSFKQTVSIIYKDGAPMYTYGGVFIKGKDRSKYDNCQFHRILHTNSEDKHIEIKVPELTLKEVDFLNSLIHLPEDEIDIELEKYNITKSEFQEYKNIYRYFPYFSEVNIG